MITAVDSSVILDILTAAPIHLTASLAKFKQCAMEGKMIVCPIVWGEVRPALPSDQTMEQTMEKMGLIFEDFGVAVASRAGVLWRSYRRAKGKRDRLVADFLIGAHAEIRADRLLTRDRGFYRTSFRNLTIIEP